MDIKRGSLDKISKPASSSRAHPHCRPLNTAMELLTPEPHVPKVDSPINLADSHQRGSPEENKGDDREKTDFKEIRTDEQTTVESTTFLQKCILNSRCLSNSDSEGVGTETLTLKFFEPCQGKLSNAKAGNASSLEYSGEADVDPQIQAAIRKMNKLDTVL
ncbi:Fibrous sheath-interacting protein 1, partial [Calypte anna]